LPPLLVYSFLTFSKGEGKDYHGRDQSTSLADYCPSSGYQTVGRR
jgi:hypothetical protein